MKNKILTLGAVLAAIVVLLPAIALAYTPFTFDIGVPNLALSTYTSPFLQVTITETSATTANFDVVSLTNGNYLYLFGDGGAFAGNFAGTVTLSNFVPTVWDNTPTITNDGSGNVSDFGVMNTKLKFSDGYTSALKELTFTATLTSGTWSDSDSVLVANGTGYFAAGHIFVQDTTNTGAGAVVTGFAGNGTSDNPVPIPGSVLLLGSGLLGLVGLRKFRKK